MADIVQLKNRTTNVVEFPVTVAEAVVDASGSHLNTFFSGGALIATKLKTARKIGISGGATGTGTLFDGSSNITIPVTSMRADYLKEPDTIRATTTPTTMPLVNTIRANHLAFLPADQCIIEQTTDGGTTWTDAEVSDYNKRMLFSGNNIAIYIPLKDGVQSTDCAIRVTITGMKYNVPEGTAETGKYAYWNSSYVRSSERYFSLGMLYVWCCGYSDRIRVTVQKATGAASDTWVTVRDDATSLMSGWSAGNHSCNLGEATFGGSTSQTTNYWNWRIIFRFCASDGTYDDSKLTTSATYRTSRPAIYRIQGYGRNIWTQPNALAGIDHLYSWDVDQNATFPARITAASFKKSGGTAAQFLKADGSVDSNAYALTSALSACLQKSGGTMTGNITMPSGGGIVLHTDTSWTNSDRSVPFGTNGNDAILSWYYTNANKGLTFNPSTGTLKAGAFMKRGGTASQFLKADGSVDSNAYAKTSDITNMVTTADGTLPAGSIPVWSGTGKGLTTQLGKGTATKPIYLDDGIPKACTYELKKTVPSNAVFTDTLNTAGTTNNDEERLFLVGAPVQASSVQTFTNRNCYLDSDGFLYARRSRLIDGPALRQQLLLATPPTLVVVSGGLGIISPVELDTSQRVQLARKGSWNTAVKIAGREFYGERNYRKKGWRFIEPEHVANNQGLALTWFSIEENENMSGREEDRHIYILQQDGHMARAGGILRLFCDVEGDDHEKLRIRNGSRTRFLYATDCTCSGHSIHTVHFALGLEDRTIFLPFDIRISNSYPREISAGDTIEDWMHNARFHAV